MSRRKAAYQEEGIGYKPVLGEGPGLTDLPDHEI